MKIRDVIELQAGGPGSGRYKVKGFEHKEGFHYRGTDFSEVKSFFKGNKKLGDWWVKEPSPEQTMTGKPTGALVHYGGSHVIVSKPGKDIHVERSGLTRKGMPSKYVVAVLTNNYKNPKVLWTKEKGFLDKAFKAKVEKD